MRGTKMVHGQLAAKEEPWCLFLLLRPTIHQRLLLIGTIWRILSSSRKCFQYRVLREELAEDVDDVLAVQDALGAEVPAGGVERLEHADVRVCDIAHVHVRLHGVGVLLGRAVEVLEDVRDAGVHRRLQQRPDHEHGVHDDEVDAPLLGRVPRRLLRHGLAVAVPVLMHRGINGSC